MELEEAIKILEDCLSEIHRTFCKVGAVGIPSQEYFALETLLNYVTKQDKMIKLMVEKYNDDFGDIGDFCQHEYCSKDYNCKECIKQYFEKKAEEDL